MTEELPLGTEHDGVLFSPVRDDVREVEELIRHQFSAAERHLADASAYAVQVGGKRLRPAAFLLLVRLLGERPTLPHLVTAAVLEMCHTASLLHDDVLDHATVRRSRASLNVVRGNRETVLFGDYILAKAFDLLADLARPELVSIMANLVREVCSGEIRQWARRSFDLDESEYFAIVRAKTASFFRFAGTLAGRLATLGKAQTALLESWGDGFGIAYQIVDDIYDIVSPRAADKSTGQDARSGLLTLPWIRLRDRFGTKALRERYLVRQGVGELLRDLPLLESLRASAAAAEHSIAEATRSLEPFSGGAVREALDRLGDSVVSKARDLVDRA